MFTTDSTVEIVGGIDFTEARGAVIEVIGGVDGERGVEVPPFDERLDGGATVDVEDEGEGDEID